MVSDTGGSIRIPSAACGCVGLKPTYGLLPLAGVIPLAASLDHVGPICRCVEDAALLLSILSVPGGQKTARPGTGRLGSKLRAGVKGMRIGMPRSYFFDRLQNDIRSKVLEAISCLEDLGAEIEEVPLKGMNETAQLASEITLGEALAYHWKWMPKRLGD
jgi:aspartyl-tRNA(Asn)/glutamyl-tRNA(Gln) amidotransferase subunit A